jgi:hypothetical protein
MNQLTFATLDDLQLAFIQGENAALKMLEHMKCFELGPVVELLYFLIPHLGEEAALGSGLID